MNIENRSSSADKICLEVGKIIILASQIDHLLTEIIVLHFGLSGKPFSDLLIAGIPSRQKLRILKAYAKKHVQNAGWKNGIVDATKKVDNWLLNRDIAAHAVLMFDDSNQAVLLKTDAVSILTGIDTKSGRPKHYNLSDLVEWVSKGHEAIELIKTLKYNINHLAEEREIRNSQS